MFFIARINHPNNLWLLLFDTIEQRQNLKEMCCNEENLLWIFCLHHHLQLHRAIHIHALGAWKINVQLLVRWRRTWRRKVAASIFKMLLLKPLLLSDRQRKDSDTYRVPIAATPPAVGPIHDRFGSDMVFHPMRIIAQPPVGRQWSISGLIEPIWTNGWLGDYSLILIGWKLLRVLAGRYHHGIGPTMARQCGG